MRLQKLLIPLICYSALTTSVFATVVHKTVVYDSPTAIESSLEKFRTFSRKSLIPLLASYGLKVEHVLTRPLSDMNAAVKKGDRREDLVLSISIVGNAKSMPCNLHNWMSEGIPKNNKYRQEHIAEITLRDGIFRTDYPDLDPVLYWAAKGKCSSAY